MSSYRIREVDGDDDEVADTIHYLHKLTFGDTAPPVVPEDGWWWLVFTEDKEPVAFAGLRTWQRHDGELQGYLNRVGVLEEHRGQGLQRKLIRVRERKAKKLGCVLTRTDTTDNPASGNSLINAGYRLYAPEHPWAFPHSLYWRKSLG